MKMKIYLINYNKMMMV